MNNIDLHIHSNSSIDGEFDPIEIVIKSFKNKLKLISITDHNTTKGIKNALNKSNELGIKIIPGIEIDCCYENTDFHLLGYNINWGSNDFNELENNFKSSVLDSLPEMIRNLNRLGIINEPDEILKEINGKIPCGELIAEILLTNPKYYNKKLKPYLNGGLRSDQPYINFYYDFFAQGKPAYVKIDYMSYNDALELILDNGGIPVVAHPGVNFMGNEEIVGKLIKKGAKGVEVFNNYHTNKQIRYFAELAIKEKYLMTCGSDFHGKNKPLIEIGKYNMIEKYKSYIEKSLKDYYLIPV